MNRAIVSYLRSPWQVAKNLRWRLAPSESQLPVVFVVGAPRSGTTLIQQVLACHSRFYSVNRETGLFGWQNLFDPSRRHFGLSGEQLRELYSQCSDSVQFFERAVEMAFPARGIARFVEKTPQHVFRIGFLLKHFPRASIVNIVRDGRDCLCSSRIHENVPQRHSAVAFSRYWARSVRAAESWRASDRVFHVKYENFVADPSGQLARIMAFLDEAPEPAQLDPSALGNDHRATLERFKRLGMKIDGSSVSRWRAELSPEEVEDFRRIAGRELSVNGYELA